MKKTSLKDHLENSIPEELISKVNRSFEIVGDIAIIEVSEELNKYSKEIGEALLRTNSAIKVVLKKSGIHQGEYRTQNLDYVCGENRKETEYLENGIRLKINPETVYFSAKLGTERLQLMENLEPNKRVLVMFSGAGPYSFVAMKKQPNLSQIVSIEINPQGHKYALESLQLNKNLVKKSNLFKELILFMRDNELPIYEKKVVELMNNLKLIFINGDVEKIVLQESFNFEEGVTGLLENNHNKLFEMKPKDIFDFLNQAEFESLRFNLNLVEDRTKILYFSILFSEKFSFEVLINNKLFKFSTSIQKGNFINFLENNLDEIQEGFDEILMPLPKDAKLFLESAFRVSRKGTKVHMYDFVHENDFPTKSEESVRDAAKKNKLNVEIISTRKVGQYSPRKFRVCCDFTVK